MAKALVAGRRGVVAATSAVSIVLLVATAAWACTVNMMGNIWFTSYNAPTNSCTTTTVTRGSAGSTWCSNAAGLQMNTVLTPGNKYELRYAASTATVDCHNSPLKIKNNDSPDGLFTATVADNGGWRNKRVTLPSKGSYIVCAATPAAAAAGAETGWWSNSHISITVT